MKNEMVEKSKMINEMVEKANMINDVLYDVTNHIKELQDALCDLIDGNDVEDIIYLTGLSEKRAREIYDLYVNVLKAKENRLYISDKIMKYHVFYGNRPAKYSNINSSWKNNVFDNFEDAEEYAQNWLGSFDPGKNILKPNIPYDYDGYGDMIEIRTVKG